MDRVVIDTNVLLVSVSRKSSLHWIFQKLIDGAYELCVTTEVLLEYEEIIERKMGKRASAAALGILENLENVTLITTYYEFGLLSDVDDNKFVDCAVAANADYIVSEDKDFKPLKKVTFPKVKVIKIKDFQNRMK